MTALILSLWPIGLALLAALVLAWADQPRCNHRPAGSTDIACERRPHHDGTLHLAAARDGSGTLYGWWT